MIAQVRTPSCLDVRMIVQIRTPIIPSLNKHLDKKKSCTKNVTSSEASVKVKKSSKPKRASSHDTSKSDPDPAFYQEVDMSDLPSQYTENIETFRQFLILPDPRNSMPGSFTTVWALNNVTVQQELRSFLNGTWSW